MTSSHEEPRLPLALQAYRMIHEKIITMDYEPGQHLEEKHLVSELGIGRTPVREALLRLTSEFLVESQPNRGFIVKPLTLQNIKAMFEALRIIEIGAASLAVHQDPARHLSSMREAQENFEAAMQSNDLLRLVWTNHEFHMHFARCSSNEYLVRALQDVRNEVNRLAYLSFGGKEELAGDLLQHYRTVCREHEQIMDSLEHKDLGTLKKTIEAHIHSFQHRVVLYLTTSGV